MPLRNATPLTWAPHGCSDAVDGSSAFKGAMTALTNLVPSPATNDQFVPRPARDYLANLVASGQFMSPTTITALAIFGDIVFGLVTTRRNPGRDEAFAISAISGGVIPVQGVTLSNSPTTAPLLGATQLPLSTTVAQHVLFTHPGFAGGIYNPSAASTTITANTHNGSPIVDGFFLTGGIFPGQFITGAGIPSDTYVFSIAPIAIVTTGSGSMSSNMITVADPTGIVVGLAVNGVNVGSGQVTGVVGSVVSYSGTLAASITDETVSFTGSQITMSKNATSSNNGEAVLIEFAGDVTAKVGWFDLTGLDIQMTGTTMTASNVIAVSTVAELSPGQFVTGPGIPAGARIFRINNPTITDAPGNILGGDTNLFIVVPTMAGQDPFSLLPADGATVTGPGIASGTTVVSSTFTSLGNSQINFQVVISAAAATSQNFSGLYTIGGLYSIEITALATASATVTLTFTGGTLAAPLWCAGDVQIFNLPSTPVGIGQLNGRAYYACGRDGLVFSDPLSPLIRTNANQALIPGNGLAVTACVGQPLNTPVTGGIIESLYAFQGTSAVQQITGDPTTANLAMNPLNIQTGTNSPAAIVPTTRGMAFTSPEGQRFIDFSGAISQPIGEAGAGVTVPFSNAVDPTRIVAAANGTVLRIAVQNAQQLGQPWVEWWYDISRPDPIWTGPHTLQTRAIVSYGSTFITAAQDVPAQLYKSPVEPAGSADYEEDGATLTWLAQPVLLPDTEVMFQNFINEATLGLILPSDMAVTVQAFDEAGEQLDSVVLPGAYDPPLFGGPPVWGSGLWYAVQSFYTQMPLNWHRELNFKQISFQISGLARFGVALGALRLRLQRTGYLMQPYPTTALDVSVPALPGAARALQANTSATQGTVIGAVQVLPAHQTAIAVAATLALPFNQGNNLAFAAYSSLTLTGNSHVSTTLDGLSADVITAGWLPGHLIADTQGALLPGTYIVSIAAGGLSVVLSQAARRALTGLTLAVTGTNLVTNWTSPIAAGAVTGQIQAEAEGYLTSYWPFLVTVN